MKASMAVVVVLMTIWLGWASSSHLYLPCLSNSTLNDAWEYRTEVTLSPATQSQIVIGNDTMNIGGDGVVICSDQLLSKYSLLASQDIAVHIFAVTATNNLLAYATLDMSWFPNWSGISMLCVNRTWNNGTDDSAFRCVKSSTWNHGLLQWGMSSGEMVLLYAIYSMPYVLTPQVNTTNYNPNLNHCSYINSTTGINITNTNTNVTNISVNVTCVDIDNDDYSNYTLTYVSYFNLTLGGHAVPQVCNEMISPNETLIVNQPELVSITTQGLNITELLYDLVKLPLSMCSTIFPCGPTQWFGHNFLMATRALAIMPTSPIYLDIEFNAMNEGVVLFYVSYTNLLEPQSALRVSEFREFCTAQTGVSITSRHWWVSPTRPLYIKVAWMPNLGFPAILPAYRSLTLQWSLTNDTFNNMTIPSGVSTGHSVSPTLGQTSGAPSGDVIWTSSSTGSVLIVSDNNNNHASSSVHLSFIHLTFAIMIALIMPPLIRSS